MASRESDEDVYEQMLEAAKEEADAFEREYWAARGVEVPW